MQLQVLEARAKIDILYIYCLGALETRKVEVAVLQLGCKASTMLDVVHVTINRTAASAVIF